MDLKGAEIRNVYGLCREMTTSPVEVPLSVNIPHYQRPYKWDEERIRNLISDFFKSIEDNPDNKEKEYFVGSVVLVKNAKLSDNWQDIIDGQQRITTVFLLNYLKFLLLRATAEDLLIRKSVASFGGQMNDLIRCYSSMIGSEKNSDLTKLKDELIAALDTIDSKSDSAEKNEEWDKILKKYQDGVGLPIKDLSNLDSYKEEYKKKLSSFFKSEKLALRYSRESYNRKLKEALSKVVILADSVCAPKLEINYDDNDAIINQYALSIKYGFDALTVEACQNSNTPIERLKTLISAIDKMLSSVKFCVIMTGNENDAYTLFEVLNDRAMKVDDLDLIKNLFLKEYCNKSGDLDNEMDETVSEIDRIWGDEIFNHTLSQTHTKLISYLGTIYLTADEDIYMNKVEKYREVLDKKYFSIKYADKPYTALDVKNDVMIYKLLKELFDIFNLHVNGKDKDALSAEIDTRKSITYKTVHLSNAMNQNGVMAAITNLIIRTYIDTSVKEGEGININDYKKFIENLRDDGSNSDTRFQDIHKWAFEIWKVILAAKDYNGPRKISRDIISKVSTFNNDIKNLHIDANEIQNLRNECYDWTTTWQYGKGNLRVRILFVELFSTTKGSDRLKYSPTSMSFRTNELHLDHLEAKNVNEGSIEKYFKPSNSNDRREIIVNGLGNMMILDQEDNNDKKNLPLQLAMEFYYKMCPGGHWLIDEIKDMLKDDTYHNSIDVDGDTIFVPNDEFFKERLNHLQKYFLAILNRTNLNDTEMRFI